MPTTMPSTLSFTGLVIRPDSAFSRDDVERLLKANGPDLHWTSLGKEPDSVDWKGERGGKVLMRALWIFNEGLSVFLSEE
jgi:hypothetical protein